MTSNEFSSCWPYKILSGQQNIVKNGLLVHEETEYQWFFLTERINLFISFIVRTRSKIAIMRKKEIRIFPLLYPWFQWRNQRGGKWAIAHFILSFAHWDSICWDSFIYEVDENCISCLFGTHLHSRPTLSYHYFVYYVCIFLHFQDILKSKISRPSIKILPIGLKILVAPLISNAV